MKNDGPNGAKLGDHTQIVLLKAIWILLLKQLRYEFYRGLVSIYVAELFRLMWRPLPCAHANRWGISDHGRNLFCCVFCSCSGDRACSSGALSTGCVVCQLFSLCGACGCVGVGVGCGVGGGVDADGVRRYDGLGGVEFNGGFDRCGFDWCGFDRGGCGQGGFDREGPPACGVAFGSSRGFCG